MPIVKYPDYRSYERLRIQTNDTMMGLLVGSKLAAVALEQTASREVTLSRMFPSVDHIRRFDHRVDTARDVLENAESLLGAMAVPYVLGLQEDLFVGMLNLLDQQPTITVQDLAGTKTANMHTRFENATSTTFEGDDVELFSLVRIMRNMQIHNGGKASEWLESTAAGLSGKAKDKWQDIAGVPAPSYAQGDEVSLSLPELIVILAVSKRLADKANFALQNTLSRPFWLQMLKDDWVASEPKKGNAEQQLKKLKGYARMFYEPLKFSEAEIESIC
ncbi:hypothetical protein NtRootA4_32130 [Arthrobacter sp. NtRootA4]|nr:hypothetical protein NtRootA2_34330 [Arthrobacter sp. NtRootA2]BCW16234.1 hypothetical protein NtRootA4_32130 [Arthrobacter sp. NtRootA4]BCW24566.1 hypothetical protein NtRootC7_34330 [Arthrobacter sp. NtRootC7]BCW28836.1 hypothetical protein NtRootC45_34360 [Arthrobacter sp. NtRootC45]BCW33106.1 hypothetical protein NtRootD5_34370 [Arthrobacter sp. NtRootD5]